ncbi:hypothetical protein SODALDRAFT_182990 [Sodiomyces alkalinus F11]|uniref:Uncharacterized protein n=1 Tax=Sodiomyces alkalinus (strain CBS 110278 / VKM F-3762 / F11) TaxID=1314773 RepID=A0A3N2PUK0_SODAK|nr:hypothetical protein SODALDRAFT_182990 [Sodiomyces alkalinus F11]ROT38160.1 hypothetical protein SODALDRAFT_182990 [Sodiomyces alkalinus F11]
MLASRGISFSRSVKESPKSLTMSTAMLITVSSSEGLDALRNSPVRRIYRASPGPCGAIKTPGILRNKKTKNPRTK